MPFVAYNPNGEKIQLCCLKRNDVWKVHYFDKGIWRKLATYTNVDATECCPTAEWDFEENKWVISFIAGGSTLNDWSDVEFSLYKKYDFDDSKPVKVVPADVGYIQKGELYFASKVGPIFNYFDGITTIYYLTDKIKFIYRLNYNPNAPNELLISALTNNDETISFIYDVSSEKTYVLKDGEEPCYKCCFDGDDVYYCRKNLNENFDDRQIVKATHLNKIEVETSDYIKDVKTTEEDIFEGEL